MELNESGTVETVETMAMVAFALDKMRSSFIVVVFHCEEA